MRTSVERAVRIPEGGAVIDGDLVVPEPAEGVVVFAHGTGSGRHSPRNQFVAGELQRAGLATLLLDLLTGEEEQVDLRTRHLRFDIGLLARRLLAAGGGCGRTTPSRGCRSATSAPAPAPRRP
jgi:putative phosphoribosyl transferase